MRNRQLPIHYLACLLGALAPAAAAAAEADVVFKFTSVGNQTYQARFQGVDVACPTAEQPGPVKLTIEPDRFVEIEPQAGDEPEGAKQAFGMKAQVENALRGFKTFELVLAADAVTLERRGRTLTEVETGQPTDLASNPAVLKGTFDRIDLGLGNAYRAEESYSLREKVAVEVEVDCGAAGA